MTKPILAFRPGATKSISPSKPRPILGPHAPEHARQVERVSPQLFALKDALDRHAANIQTDIQGLEPEFVLVFEVVGGVNDFYKAAEKAGMEWLLDVDSSRLADDEFYELGREGERSNRIDVSEKLYLTMTNQRSMEQMLSLWNMYSRSEEMPHGFSKFRDVFSLLRSIRRWEASDRLEETAVSALTRILNDGTDTIRFEIELWYRQDEEKRMAQKQYVESVIRDKGGSVIHESIHRSIAFHGIIAECPSDEIRRMISDMSYPLLSLDAVKFVKPSGQTATHLTDAEEVDDSQRCDDEKPVRDPVIALFDGLPLANHTLLSNRLIINDPDSFENEYLVSQRQHGTYMSSLIIHGDLHKKMPALDSYLYVRPVMKPNASGYESVPTDRFFVDILHQAVLEIVSDPTLASIRIVNISIGDSTKPFAYALSPEAKMLDYLGEKYGLLFIVSAGNNSDIINAPYTNAQFKNFDVKQKQKAVYDSIWGNLQNRRILAPAEAINVITVAASYQDFFQPHYYGHQLPVVENYPAPYSCLGPGYKNSIKPDMINNGGRLGYSCGYMDRDLVELKAISSQSASGVGQGVASPDSLTAQINICGTSNAAALTSRLCADYLEVLHDNNLLSIPIDYEAVALKAMLIHSCSWGRIGQDLMDSYVPDIPRRRRAETLKWIGYGFPNKELSSFCTDQRVTVMGHGGLNAGMQTNFSFPLPDCLMAQAVKKRLTITLAWMSPIASNNKKYKLANLFFDTINQEKLVKEIEDSDVSNAKRGTVQHEVFENNTASTYVSGTNLEISVKCKKDSITETPVKYVLMATLEVAPDTQLPIYQEVEALVRAQVRIP